MVSWWRPLPLRRHHRRYRPFADVIIILLVLEASGGKLMGLASAVQYPFVNCRECQDGEEQRCAS
jgi:hypothetical protein